MNENELVTICLHTGKIENVYLLQNTIKSFLQANKYPNIELILIETGQNIEVRKWIKDLDLNNFINFNGSRSTIKPHPGVSIIVKKIFPDFEDSNKLFSKKSAPFIQSLEIAIEKSEGKYFTYLAEDNQFVVSGDVITDYINVLKKESESTSMIHFVTHQLYKYNKHNNRFKEPAKVNEFLYFPIEEVKWDQNIFCNKNLIYDKLGPIKDWEKAHGTNKHYTKLALQNSLKRFYPGIAVAAWFHNNSRESFIREIKIGTEKNPDFILFQIKKYEELKMSYNSNVGSFNRPLSTEELTIKN